MSNKKKIYTVATAHLDTVWNWDFETTVSKYIYNTLVDNFKLLKKYPSYKFNFEGSYRYELMEEYYPQLFEKMKEYIKEGRWSVCGSAFENGDTNIPSPEALFRNILFGNSYFDKKFGKRSVDIFLPDCFGFGWALPSVAHHANLKGFTTQKLTWGSAYGTPFDIGKWYGVDGEFVYACVNPHDYYFTLKKLRDWDFVQEKLKKNEDYDLDWTYIFHGIGDRGGAPEEASVAFVEQEAAKNGESDIEVAVCSADEIYHDIENKLTDEQREKLPEWKTELVMQNHAVGGYTSRAIGKRWNRRCEELADLAERASVAADYLGVYDYNREGLNRSWKRFVAHQFHDDLPGTSVQRAYMRSWNDYAVSANQFAGELEAASLAVSSLMKTDFCSGIPVVVSNPVEAEVHSAVRIRLKNINKPFIRVFDDSGKEVKSQVNSNENGVMEAVFIADVKSLGFRVYDVRPSDEACRLESSISINTDNVLENQKYIVTLNKRGNISSIVDKTLDERELLKEPIALCLFNYTGSKPWPAWEMNYEEANKEPDRVAQLVTISIEENGPARVAFKVVQQDKHRSLFTNIIALTDGGECVEVYSEIEWQALLTMAKNKFSFTCENEKATFDLGLGAIQRGNMSEKLFEVPAQKWADITDKSGEFGVSVISECKYGWDKFSDNTLRMTVLHTPKHNFRTDSIYIDSGNWKARQGGNGVEFAKRSIIEFTPCAAEENSFNYELQRPISESFYELFLPFGVLDFEMGNPRLGEVYVINGKGELALKLQGRIGKTNLKVTIYKNNIAGAKNLKGAEEKIKCQLTKYQMCMGCLACEGICRQDAITIRENAGEIYYGISDERCVHCGECVGHFIAGCYMRKVLAIKR